MIRVVKLGYYEHKTVILLAKGPILNKIRKINTEKTPFFQ